MIRRFLRIAPKGAIVDVVNSGVSGPNVTEIVQCREIHSVVPFEIQIAILQSVSKWQYDKVNWSGKNADFSTSISCHGNVP